MGSWKVSLPIDDALQFSPLGLPPWISVLGAILAVLMLASVASTIGFGALWLLGKLRPERN